MTFNVTVPNAGQSPGQFPAQNNTNFTRLKTIINAEHVFNDTAGVDDGVHRQMTMVARADPSSLPAGTNGVYYSKVSGSTAMPFYYDGTSIFALAPVRASITWNSAGVVQGTPFGASVSQISTGTFDVTFSPALPSKHFQFSINSYTLPIVAPTIGTVIALTMVGATVTVMRIRFVRTTNGAEIGITEGNLIIFGG